MFTAEESIAMSGVVEKFLEERKKKIEKLGLKIKNKFIA